MSFAKDHDTQIFNTSDPVILTGECLLHIAKQARELFQDRENATIILTTLDTSQLKFQSWKNQWIEGHNLSKEVLWGEKGWANVKKNLEDILRRAHEISSKYFTRKTESNSQSRLKRALSTLPKRNNDSSVSEWKFLFELSIDLNKSIDQLWTYSDVAFDSLHGLLSRTISSPKKEERGVSDSVNARLNAVALFQACSNSGLDCYLEMAMQDILQKINMSNGGVPSESRPRIAYHIFTQPREPDEKCRDITVEALIKVEHDERCDKSDFQSANLRRFENLEKDQLSCVQAKRSDAQPVYFRILQPSKTLEKGFKSKNFAQSVRTPYRISSGKFPGTFTPGRYDLAFQLVQCVFYLLGTPWLAGFNRRRISRLKSGKQRYHVLEAPTYDIEDLVFEDPEALVESAQLFRVGVMLMEIALDKDIHLDSHSTPGSNLEDIRENLLLVEHSMGHEYRKAAAFCLQERISTPTYYNPNKFHEPTRRSWSLFLTKLLNEYVSEVLLRLKDLRDIEMDLDPKGID